VAVECAERAVGEGPYRRSRIPVHLQAAPWLVRVTAFLGISAGVFGLPWLDMMTTDIIHRRHGLGFALDAAGILASVWMLVGAASLLRGRSMGARAVPFALVFAVAVAVALVPSALRLTDGPIVTVHGFKGWIEDLRFGEFLERGFFGGSVGGMTAPEWRLLLRYASAEAVACAVFSLLWVLCLRRFTGMGRWALSASSPRPGSPRARRWRGWAARGRRTRADGCT
jgi:hypothetical protein